MLIPSWLTRSHAARAQRANNRPRPTFRPGVEDLEDRDLMTATLAISDVTITEGSNQSHNHALFTVTLSEPAVGTVTVNYQTADGTATAGQDYAAAAGTLTFAPGETSKTVSVEILGDRNEEPRETFFVNLSGAMNADIWDDLGLGTIIDDDTHTGGGHGGCKGHGC